MTVSTRDRHSMAKAHFRDAQFSGRGSHKGEVLVPFLEARLHRRHHWTKSRFVQTAVPSRSNPDNVLVRVLSREDP